LAQASTNSPSFWPNLIARLRQERAAVVGVGAPAIMVK
jgi:hypothetical protein